MPRCRSTVIYVTHDQVEAMTLADRIVIMRDGHIEQVGTPDEVFRRPATRFVAGFIGSPPMNLNEATVDGGQAGVCQRRRRCRCRPQFKAQGRRPATRWCSACAPMIFTRPGTASIPAKRQTCTRSQLPVIDHRTARQRDAGVHRVRRRSEWVSRMLNPKPLRPAKWSRFSFDLSQAHLFAAETGKTLRG